ncbi:unnamed protein product, partial [Cylicocyclus nassatus]
MKRVSTIFSSQSKEDRGTAVKQDQSTYSTMSRIALEAVILLCIGVSSRAETDQEKLFEKMANEYDLSGLLELVPVHIAIPGHQITHGIYDKEQLKKDTKKKVQERMEKYQGYLIETMKKLLKQLAGQTLPPAS